MEIFTVSINKFMDNSRFNLTCWLE